MNYLDRIKKEIEVAFAKATSYQGKINFAVTVPDTLEHGDATSNICLVASKVLGKSPKEIFENLEPHLASHLKRGGVVEKIEFVNPGFINFYLTEKFVRENLVEKKNFWQKFLAPLLTSPLKRGGIVSEKYSGRKVLVEFTSVNLFKPFTIGHLMSNFTGEYVSRSLESQGAKVVRISYPSDISIGIAKAIWVIKNEGGLKQEIFSKDEKQIVKYLGECYVKGVNAYKEVESEVKKISNNLYGNIKSEDLEIYEFTKKININYFKRMIENLGTKFDGFIFESEAGEVGKKIVLENTGENKIFQKSEGAIIYTPSEERKDISTSVFINSEGNPTYLAKDIGLLDLKFKKYSPLDYSIYVVDNEQNSHFKSVFDAGGKIKKEWEEKSVHVSHGRMTFRGQKMSSRLGGVPSGEEVIDAVYEDVVERSQDSEKLKPHLASPLKRGGAEQILREVALSALRISILRSKPGLNIDFDPDRASSFEGDSGPYLCYTHARCASLLQKASQTPGGQCLVPRPPGVSSVPTYIERKVLQFKNILKISAEEIAPQKLVKYLFELSGEFNNFYAHTKILDEKNLELTKFNLYLTKLVKDTLQKGLYILGVEAPEVM